MWQCKQTYTHTVQCSGKRSFFHAWPALFVAVIKENDRDLKLQSVHRWASRFWHTLSLPLLTLLTSGVWVAVALSSCPLLEFQYEDVKESKLFRSHLWVRQKRRSVPSPHENTTWEWLMPMTNVIMFDISYVMANQMCAHLPLCEKKNAPTNAHAATWTPC